MNVADLAELNRCRTLRMLNTRNGTVVCAIMLTAFEAAGDGARSGVTNAVHVAAVATASWCELLDETGRVVGTGPLFTREVETDGT